MCAAASFQRAFASTCPDLSCLIPKYHPSWGREDVDRGVQWCTGGELEHRAGTHPLRASVSLISGSRRGMWHESSADLMDILKNFLQRTSRKEKFLIT